MENKVQKYDNVRVKWSFLLLQVYLHYFIATFCYSYNYLSNLDASYVKK